MPRLSQGISSANPARKLRQNLLNDLDRFHSVNDVIDRVPKLGSRVAYAKQAIRDKLFDISNTSPDTATTCRKSRAGGGARMQRPRERVRQRRTTSDLRGTTVKVFLVRHGETAWSLSGQHTGTTDLPLTDNGRRRAEQMRPVLARYAFGLVLCSPMERARETCELAGPGDKAVIDPDLVEWNYGEYEGLTTKQIHEGAPGWLLFRDGCPSGETPEQVGARLIG